MRIADIKPQTDLSLIVTLTDGRVGRFDVRPYLDFEAFTALQDYSEFMKIHNGSYFIEWDCGADLSADTIAARLT
ncbi:MAG: DUF2442 domain-containing protein [Trichlorobacter sp.]|jgi:hypothetical protein|nr:DUF2442 domain-containing protein [Trichlorobacter sp.]